MVILLASLAAIQMVAGLFVLVGLHDLDEFVGALSFGLGTLTLAAASAVKHLSAIRADQRRSADAIVSIWHGQRPKLDLVHPDLLRP